MTLFDALAVSDIKRSEPAKLISNYIEIRFSSAASKHTNQSLGSCLAIVVLDHE